VLKYFQDRTAGNLSFQHAIQFDCDKQITNIFWADAKLVIDYAHFFERNTAREASVVTIHILVML
jgi:hypothetical protein